MLNVTSTKKRDTMLTSLRPFDNVGVKNGTAGQIQLDSLNGNAYFVWAMTGRSFSQDDSPNMVAQRTKPNTFAVGLKEKMMFITSDGNPWMWRRIVFSMYGTACWQIDSASNIIDFPTVSTTGPNYQRGFVSMGTDTTGTAYQLQARTNLRARLFRGVLGTDYSNYLTAPTNTDRVIIHYDKTRRIDSQNDEGGYKVYKQWHPVRKHLQYADTEAGRDSVPLEWSTESRKSCGDYYIFDFFSPFTIVEGVTLDFRSDATYYWHER